MKSISCINFKKAIIICFPIFCAFIPLGMGFGYMAQQLNISKGVTIVMALLIYAGSAEFIIVSMLAQNVSITDILVATTLCNLRHIFYGISVKQFFPTTGLIKFYMIYTLSDETYAILSTTKNATKELSFIISILNHFYWVLGVTLGVMLNQIIDIPVNGLDFILTSLFVVLTIEQAYYIKQSIPFLLTLLICILSSIAFPIDYLLFISICFTVLVLILFKNKIQPIKSI